MGNYTRLSPTHSLNSEHVRTPNASEKEKTSHGRQSQLTTKGAWVLSSVNYCSPVWRKLTAEYKPFGRLRDTHTSLGAATTTKSHQKLSSTQSCQFSIVVKQVLFHFRNRQFDLLRCRLVLSSHYTILQACSIMAAQGLTQEMKKVLNGPHKIASRLQTFAQNVNVLDPGNERRWEGRS